MFYKKLTIVVYKYTLGHMLKMFSLIRMCDLKILRTTTLIIPSSLRLGDWCVTS